MREARVIRGEAELFFVFVIRCYCEHQDRLFYYGAAGITVGVCLLGCFGCIVA
jgi:hypothetical protein